jgi:large subunit ribosomal protein L2
LLKSAKYRRETLITMKLNKVKPNTNGVRHQLNLTKSLLSKNNRIFKSSLKGLKSNAGRSTINGRITTRHRGAGCKSAFRQLDKTNKVMHGIVLTTLFDPKRSSFISLNYNFITSNFFLNPVTESVYTGSIISCDKSNTDLKLGYRTILKNIPTGSLVHSLSISDDKKSQYIKSAGTFGQLIQKDFKLCKVKLPSGIIITLSINSYATLGTVSNKLHNLVVLGKAGRNRLKGIRPSVRGIAMNPVDHPHGGRSNGGKPPVTPWGKPTRGKPTVNKN